jgi:hypothetical protein
MSERVRQQEERDAEREAERIRTLLRRHGGRDYDAFREQEHYEGGFVIEPGGTVLPLTWAGSTRIRSACGLRKCASTLRR